MSEHSFSGVQAHDDPLLEMTQVKKYYPVSLTASKAGRSYVAAVDGVSFSLRRGSVMGIVGESGCGKSTVGRLAVGLIKPTAGAVLFDGSDIAGKNVREMKNMRRRMQIVFQDPFSSLDPRMTVYDIVGEAMKNYLNLNRFERRERVEALVKKCGLFADQCTRYPHQFSGGQRQRICIARALATDPDFIVCDEAVSALDVSIQAQIINLFKDLQEEMGLSYLFVSHDLSVVEFISDEVAVMYLGQIVEKGSVGAIFDTPAHPYTIALLGAVPVFTPGQRRRREILEGSVPSPINPPLGCRFASRCKYASDVCRNENPALKEIEAGHFAACHRV